MKRFSNIPLLLCVLATISVGLAYVASDKELKPSTSPQEQKFWEYNTAKYEYTSYEDALEIPATEAFVIEEISQTLYEENTVEKSLAPPTKVEKKDGVLVIPCKITTVNFEDQHVDNDEQSEIYSYVGFLATANMHIVRVAMYESESYYWVHHDSAKVEKSFGFPIFSPDLNYCLIQSGLNTASEAHDYHWDVKLQKKAGKGYKTIIDISNYESFSIAIDAISLTKDLEIYFASDQSYYRCRIPQLKS